jgi:Papain-like cysteine protease AvrRpt2
MAHPDFLGPGTTINLNSSALTTATTPGAMGGGAPGSRVLGFAIQSQPQSNWCWAAVSTSVARFYDSSSSWTQCTVADQALRRNDCCAGGASDPQKCNKPWYLDRALGVTGNLESAISRTLTFAEVQTEIAADAPIGCRVGWYGGGGHFLVIAGWVVATPALNTSSLPTRYT